MMEAFVVPENTVVNAKGDGPALDVSRMEGRVFLLTLAITNIVEQESLDVGIFGSADGAAWDAKPIAAFPQKFYREEVPLLLNLTGWPEPFSEFFRGARLPEHPRLHGPARLRVEATGRRTRRRDD